MPAIQQLRTLVRAAFEEAQAKGALTFYETRVAIVQCAGLPVRTQLSSPTTIKLTTIQFQLRYSPSLANKPKSATPSDPQGPPFDPFADPSKDLHILDLSPYHYIVLNKFPVIPCHFIVATTAFEEQAFILKPEDLGAAYTCIAAYHSQGEELFGFYNSGQHSGASQRHRHIQFLPVESMRSGKSVSEGDQWDVLADQLLQNPSKYLHL